MRNSTLTEFDSFEFECEYDNDEDCNVIGINLVLSKRDAESLRFNRLFLNKRQAIEMMLELAYVIKQCE